MLCKKHASRGVLSFQKNKQKKSLYNLIIKQATKVYQVQKQLF